MRQALVVALILTATCTDATAPVFEIDPDIRAMVSDSAAMALDSNGHFQIGMDLLPGSDDTVTISGQRSRELTAAFVLKYGSVFLNAWQEDRGASITLNALGVAPRVYPVPTAFGPVPAIGCHPSTNHLFASKYLTTLVASSTPQIVMGVSARTTAYSVDSAGSLVEPLNTGNDFVHEGIPLHGTFITAPEQAVAVVARATGARITRVPVLTLRRNDIYAPTAALWQLELDHAIAWHRPNGSTVVASRIFVSPTATFLVAADTQPTSVTVMCPKVGQPIQFQSVTVPVRAGRPIDFEIVSLK